MSTGNPESLHGLVGTGLGGYSRLLDADPIQPADLELDNFEPAPGQNPGLAQLMADAPDGVHDDPDPEENLYIPAGYTYFGQFIDHDLTFDTTSTLDSKDKSTFSNQRTPRFDLDCVYGAGPDAAPYLYQDGIRLIEVRNDLPRSQLPNGKKGRAIIGDPRNDENSIVCNLQMSFIRFHNKVVDKLEQQFPPLKGSRDLFDKARDEVRWTYQKIVVEDYLPRIVSNETLKTFDFRRDPSPTGLTRNEAAYALFTAEKRGAIPLEFSGAAYRYGHSMVRNGYRLNTNQQAPTLIFDPQGSADKSLTGFQPLDELHVINDWSLFFPNPDRISKLLTPGQKDDANNVSGQKRLQYAYRIDTTLVDPLTKLPDAIAATTKNLAARNLLRGKKFQLPSGQAVGNLLGVPVLDANYLVVRHKSDDGTQTFVPISAALQEKTPLWFYVLAEAQVPVVNWWLEKGKAKFSEDDLLDSAPLTATQLGETGGRIILEVFHGLLDADPDSYRNKAPCAWTPLIGEARMFNLVTLKNL
ncbi:peroxidase family protein [Undibacterium sp. JH2W]|uniref:peroxidase family protein n=1 Tax=Undibacterium sp. JH2W TaxID=3413037 RepID=UPI003BF3A8FA